MDLLCPFLEMDMIDEKELPPHGHPLNVLATRLGELLDEDHWAECEALMLKACAACKAEADKAERRAITFGDIVHRQVLAMRAAMVDAVLNGPEAGMAWIENTLEGPGHLPDIDAARAEGGAQCMFNRELAEHEAFRAAHPAPVGHNARLSGPQQREEDHE